MRADDEARSAARRQLRPVDGQGQDRPDAELTEALRALGQEVLDEPLPPAIATLVEALRAGKS
jgi:hypothetical protein